MIPREQWKTWKPTPDMVRAAETVFLAMAHTEMIRPIVVGYQKRILADMRPLYAKEWRDKGLHGSNEVILNPDHTYLMEESDFQIYLSRCREEQARAELHTDSPDHCPLLVAEWTQTKAENALIDAMEPVTGIKAEQLYLDNRKKYLDLTLRMLARDCHSSAEIMKRVA